MGIKLSKRVARKVREGWWNESVPLRNISLGQGWEAVYTCILRERSLGSVGDTGGLEGWENSSLGRTDPSIARYLAYVVQGHQVPIEAHCFTCNQQTPPPANHCDNQKCASKPRAAVPPHKRVTARAAIPTCWVPPSSVLTKELRGMEMLWAQSPQQW